MSYRIKEIYFTQQGEGSNTGRDFVFVRFSGCTLWSGKEKPCGKCSACLERAASFQANQVNDPLDEL